MEDAPPLDNPDASPGAGEADDAIVEAEAPSGEPEQAGIAQPESEAEGAATAVEERDDDSSPPGGEEGMSAAEAEAESGADAPKADDTPAEPAAASEEAVASAEEAAEDPAAGEAEAAAAPDQGGTADAENKPEVEGGGSSARTSAEEPPAADADPPSNEDNVAAETEAAGDDSSADAAEGASDGAAVGLADGAGGETAGGEAAARATVESGEESGEATASLGTVEQTGEAGEASAEHGDLGGTGTATEAEGGRVAELKAKANAGQELSNEELAELQAGYDQLAAEQKRLGGPEPLPDAQPTPAPPDGMPEMSGHVESLELSAMLSKPAKENREPSGKQADEQPKGFTRDVTKAPGNDLSEATSGVRGLNTDVPVRSRIRRPAAPKMSEMVSADPIMPLLLAEQPEPNPNVMQLWMDADRRKAASALGFSEGGPMQSHLPDKTDRAGVPPRGTTGPTGVTALAEGRAGAPASLTAGSPFDPPTGDISASGGRAEPHEPGALRQMARVSVADARGHAAASGPYVRPPPPRAAAHSRVGDNAEPKADSNLTWASLEEMSFEDLLSLDARAAFAQLPPLPLMGERSPPPRAREAAGVAATEGADAIAGGPSPAARGHAGRARPERQAQPAAATRGAPPARRVVQPAARAARAPKATQPEHAAAPEPKLSRANGVPENDVKTARRAPGGDNKPIGTDGRRASHANGPGGARQKTGHGAAPTSPSPPRRRDASAPPRAPPPAQRGRAARDMASAPEPAHPGPAKKDSRSVPAQRPPVRSRRDAPPPPPEPSHPQPRNPQPREAPAGKRQPPPGGRHGEAHQPQQQRSGPDQGPMVLPHGAPPPMGFGSGPYAMPPMGLYNAPFHPYAPMHPFSMMPPPPAGMAAQMMHLPPPQVGMYGPGAGLAQQTWMRGDDLQSKEKEAHTRQQRA